ncbi:MAG: MnmC family methyltransferase [Oligoflexia bacterium]|nr:MnmC family methyltransferase [Oligoflexia bacterium]
METFELVTLKSGVHSLRSLKNLETFHPVTGPSAEAQTLHVDQQKLLVRAAAVAANAAPFTIWDVGLGAGANALTAVKALAKTRSPVVIHSFDRTLAPLEFALRHAARLNYPLGFEEALRALMEHRSVQLTPFLSWHVQLGDFTERLKTLDLPPPHAILYDPYSARNNPEMWTLDHFETLFLKLDPSRPCLLTNYTRSTVVRVSLLLAGFFVGYGSGTGEKGETTIASNDLRMLDRPLDQRWLERVRASCTSAPLREIDLQHPGENRVISAPDFERLRALSQFSIVDSGTYRD